MEYLINPWLSLTRNLQIVTAVILNSYRFFVVVRMAVLGLFLAWRFSHPNTDAHWLWIMSTVCEILFAFSWLLDQLPMFCPVNSPTDVNVLMEKFEVSDPSNPTRIISDLPGIDIFVYTADSEKEPPLVIANTILSILAADYPVEKLACYVSDDEGALLTFEAMAVAASFANLWVPFCRKHDIEPRNPESYFSLKGGWFRNNVKLDFVMDRRRVMREYDEFKVRINGLRDAILCRSNAYHVREEITAMKLQERNNGAHKRIKSMKIPKATRMKDGTHWPGTWLQPSAEHSKGDHASIIQVMLEPPSDEPLYGAVDDEELIDLHEVDIRIPLLVYVSREKRPDYNHNEKAGALNALVRASAIMSNSPFILNLDCDHYIHNSQAMREGMCCMMDHGGDNICYVQFPQRFNNTVFFDAKMQAFDGLQGPICVGTGCLFRRIALYGFDPPRSCFRQCKRYTLVSSTPEKSKALGMCDFDDEEMNLSLFSKRFGNSSFFIDSIPVAKFQGHPPGALTTPRDLFDASTVTKATNVISCWYEDKTEWGNRVGWIYGSLTEDVVTGYKMHNRGWKSVYYVTEQDAFRGTAPINLTDRYHQVLRWATGSVEIFFSRNNAILASPRMKLLQRLAYLKVGIYPFTSMFFIVYCFIPALSLFSSQFIVQKLNKFTFLSHLMVITITLGMLPVLEIRWFGIAFEDWWRNEKFWLINGTSAHLAAVLQVMLKFAFGIDTKWSSPKIPSITILIANVFVWLGLISITISLLWVAISPSLGTYTNLIAG